MWLQINWETHVPCVLFFVFFFFNRDLMSMSDCDGDISLSTPSIPPIYISYQAMGLPPCERPGWIKVSRWLGAILWTGWQAGTLTKSPSWNSAALKMLLSSHQSSSPTTSPPQTPPNTCKIKHGGGVTLDVIALSSHYLILSDLEWSKLDEVTHEMF